ncbi:MAG TPA: hypothetical protein DCY85_12785 [Firmicutes bacterium]|jgi:hypothetical protein|nr:hypothetical protein [Bacillota bacterium]
MSAEELKKTRKRKTTGQKSAEAVPETKAPGTESVAPARTRKRKAAAAPESEVKAKRAGTKKAKPGVDSIPAAKQAEATQKTTRKIRTKKTSTEKTNQIKPTAPVASVKSKSVKVTVRQANPVTNVNPVAAGLTDTAVSQMQIPIIPQEMDLNGASAVLGESVVERQITQPVQVVLPFQAIKVKEIVARIQDVTAEVIQDKVIIQGVIHKQIFFVGTDMVVHHIPEDAPFSTFVDVPGAITGMNVAVRTEIEGVLFKLMPDGITIDQKVVIQLFVKVTETIQVNAVTGTGPLVLIEEVVGENTTQTLTESTVLLTVPAVKVAEIQARVQDVTSEVILNKVIIQGVIHKQIFFVDTSGLERHQAEDVPFSTFVDVPGAVAGMNVQIHSEIETVLFELLTQTELLQKVVIQFFVKVTQSVQIRVMEGTGPLFKLAEVIGENSEQILSESNVILERPAIKVREIVARIQDVVAKAILNKVIVQGILHKQVFYIGTDNVEYHQAEDIPFSLFLDIPGTIAGMDVRINAIIEHIMFDLLEGNLLHQKVVIQVFAKVTREVQLRIATGQGPLVKVEQVIGENVTQVLVRRVVPIIIPPVPPTPPPAVLGTVSIVIPGVEAVITQQVLIENAVTLPVPAIKIRAVTGTILNLVGQIVPDAILVTGTVNKSVDFVDVANTVRNLQENVPFSALLPAAGIAPGTPVEISAEIENISFSLSNNGRVLNQVIVLQLTATVMSTESQVVEVITSVEFPGVQTTELLVRALVLRNSVPQLEELTVVTNAVGPGVLAIQKQVIPLDVVNDGNPNPVPVEVVTDITLGPLT